MRTDLNRDLFAPPETPISLNADAIAAALARVVSAPTYEDAIEPSRALNLLLKGRASARRGRGT